MGRMEITPRELRDIEIKESLRGYNRDDVNDLLERAAATLEAANERIRQLSERLSSAQTEAGRTRETEDILHKTLLLAQRAADEAVAEATAKSRQMVDDAEIQSRRVIAESEAEARRRGESERRRLEEEVVDLAARRDTLTADVDALQRFESEYRERMTRTLEADLTALRARATAAPGTRPETADIEMPVMPESYAGREPESTPAAPESESTSTGSSELPSAAPSSPLPPLTPAPAFDVDSMPSPAVAVVEPAAGPDEGDSRETRAVDMSSLFGGQDDDMIPRASSSATPASASAVSSSSSENPFDLLSSDAID